jgi:AcrR family transcriptional regulator
MTTARRAPGRPRSDEARARILRATSDELAERGYSALTIDAIAARAEAGRQTIYRWWNSKADVVLDAVLERAAERIPIPDEGSLAVDLELFLRATFAQRGQGPALRGLMAQALLDPAFHEAFRDRFLFARRQALLTILQRAADRGEVAPEVSLELLLDVVFGVLWYRLMLGHLPLDDDAAVALATVVRKAAR